MRRICFDIESDNILERSISYKEFPYKLKPEAKLHVVVFQDVDTKEIWFKEKEEITRDWVKDVLKDCDELIGFNSVKFDMVMLQLFGVLDYEIGYLDTPSTVFGRECKITDAIIMSRCFLPDRFGGHSLQSWGERIGNKKEDYRAQCIEAGYIQPTDPKGAEFKEWNPIMTKYCIQDVSTTLDTFLHLEKTRLAYKKWDQALRQETILAYWGVRRELFGFWFNKDFALKCVDDLQNKIQECYDKVTPVLPPKPLNKGELNSFTPPKVQLKKSGEPSSHMRRFASNHAANLTNWEGKWYFHYKNTKREIPFTEPLETEGKADITDLQHVKQTLIDVYGWEPLEFSERDLTRDSKKQSLPYPKRIESLRKYVKETLDGKFKKQRLEILGIPDEKLFEELAEKLKDKWPVRVPTSPCIRVGTEKHLCPNLVELGEKVEFVKDFALYLTFRHRLNSLSGGWSIGDEDYDPEDNHSGYISLQREEDQRVNCPAFEIGAASHRYRHKNIVNIPKSDPTVIYGKEMRSLFGAGPYGLELGMDFSSLEAKVQGHYVYKYKGGPELAESLEAEKPADIHSCNAAKLGIPRTYAKNFYYASIYGASPAKLAKMLACSLSHAKELYTGLWEAMPALSELKNNLIKFWEKTGKKYIITIDGRRIYTRSAHSCLNYLFQSTGAIAAKYTTIFVYEYLEKHGIKCDPLKYKPEVISMIEYMDEMQLFMNKKFYKFKTFKTEEEAKEFVKNWEGSQLSDIKQGKNGDYFVSLPNIISESLQHAVGRVNEMFKMNVPLTVDWVVGRNWQECH